VEVPGDWPNNSDEERLGWQIPWDRAQIVALDSETGKRLWTARRGESRVAHATPNVLVEDGRTELVSTAGDVIQGFNLDNGQRLWTVYSKGEGVVPSVVVGDGLIFTSSGFEATTIRTVKTGGSGDVTATHIAWEQRAGTPTQPSMLYVRPYLYAVSDRGIVHCYESRTGEIVWRHRIGGNHCASPVYADGKIYSLSEAGETAVLSAGADFKLLATNELHERCQASIAISQGNLFIRTEQHLYCIGPTPGSKGPAR
jgi:outer membrane protein assembly factor BamB